MATNYIQDYINIILSIIKDDKNLTQEYIKFLKDKNKEYFFSDVSNLVLNENFKITDIEELYQFRNLHFNFNNLANFFIGSLLGFIIAFIVTFNLGFIIRKAP